jgi:hypothetical protein
LDLERAIGAMSLICSREELNLVIVPLVVNLAKEELE